MSLDLGPRNTAVNTTGKVLLWWGLDSSVEENMETVVHIT